MTKTCPSCGYSPIGPFIDNCPVCAEPVRNVRSSNADGFGRSAGMPPWLKGILIAFGAVALLVAGCCGMGMWQLGNAVKDAQQAALEAQAQQEADRKARTVVLPAAQLLQEFRDDPAAADRRYKGKYLQVSGVMERTGNGKYDSTFLILHAGDEAVTVKVECFFDDADEIEEAAVGRLEKGQNVTVRGEYDGRVSHVQLRECALVE